MEYFSKVKDPRELEKVKHELEDVLRIALIGLLTVLPTVIASMCYVGALVSVDAMGTHRNIARQILMQDGHYLIA